jgi:nucleolar GTP-binding protein
MNFQNLKPIEDYKFYLDLAFRRAREKGKKMRNLKLKGSRLFKSKYIVLTKMQVISDTICARMEVIVKSYPDLDELPEFYLEMIKLHIEYGQLKKSLGAVNWLRKRAYNMLKIYKSKIDKTKDFDKINPLQTEFLGRISSMIKQVRDDFTFLEQSRKIMKGFPTIKTGLRTVAIAGFPNVGKTTLMSKLSGSTPEINSYPFTTKGINVAYIGKGKSRIQLLDTPGTLDRFEKMNNIEKIAYLAIKKCSHIIVYVFDLTREYPLDKQIKLYNRLKKDFKKDIIIFLSKSDIIDEKEIEEFKEKYPKSISDAKKLSKKIEAECEKIKNMAEEETNKTSQDD